MEPYSPSHFLHILSIPDGHGIHGLVSSGVLCNSELKEAIKRLLVSSSCFFRVRWAFPLEQLRKRHIEQWQQSMTRL